MKDHKGPITQMARHSGWHFSVGLLQSLHTRPEDWPHSNSSQFFSPSKDLMVLELLGWKVKWGIPPHPSGIIWNADSDPDDPGKPLDSPSDPQASALEFGFLYHFHRSFRVDEDVGPQRVD